MWSQQVVVNSGRAVYLSVCFFQIVSLNHVFILKNLKEFMSYNYIDSQANKGSTLT